MSGDTPTPIVCADCGTTLRPRDAVQALRWARSLPPHQCVQRQEARA